MTFRLIHRNHAPEAGLGKRDLVIMFVVAVFNLKVCPRCRDAAVNHLAVDHCAVFCFYGLRGSR